MGRYPTRAQRKDIAERRDRIRVRVERFQEAATAYYDDRGPTFLQGESLQVPFHDDVEFGEPAVPPLEAFRSPEGIPPENLKLALPSSFTSDYLDSLGLHALRDKELQLRRGQANDALQAIRVLIGQKSFQFTSNMRNVDPAAAVTRPREAIHALGRTIAAHRRVYARCRVAMIVLQMLPDELGKTYQIILDSDIKTDTSIQEPNAPGSARQKLSWIFTSFQAQTNSSDFLEECMYFYILHVCMKHNFMAIRLPSPLAPCAGTHKSVGRGAEPCSS